MSSKITKPEAINFTTDSLALKLGRLRLVAGKTVPKMHVNDVVLYSDISAALSYISELEDQIDSLGLQKAQRAVSIITD